MSKVIIPQGYHTPLSVYEMQRAIEFIKSNFQVNLGQALNLRRVSAPLFVDENSGLNDNLNGVERPVSFDIPDVGANGQVVHSLAKWKRLALKRYEFNVGKGLFTDMNAIRRDEEVDNLHSIYVDQWDWEKVISREGTQRAVSAPDRARHCRRGGRDERRAADCLPEPAHKAGARGLFRHDAGAGETAGPTTRRKSARTPSAASTARCS